MKMATIAWKTVAVTIIQFCMLFHCILADGQFYGGSMRYSMTKRPDDNYTVTIELVTIWVLGKGPCGPSCSKKDIGRSTRLTRPQRQTFYPSSLGSFSSDYRNKTTHLAESQDLDDIVNRSYNETVIAVSEDSRLEQELLYFNFFLRNGTNIDISFEGSSWRYLTLQTRRGSGYPFWHLETQINSAVRSDTEKTNRSPQGLAKRFYRAKLGTVTEICLPVIDADGDFVECSIAEYFAAGGLARNLPPNVYVHKNCTVSINASESSGYAEDTWIAVPVTLRDYTRKKIYAGKDIFMPYTYSISSATIQFVVQIKENLTTPEFVEPTPKCQHEFMIYPGTTWRTEVYAKAPKHATIKIITVYGGQGEKYLSTMQQGQTHAEVKHANIYWKPSMADIGPHIACVSATDTTGVESSEQRCFILDVQGEGFNHTTSVSGVKPYFVNIPAPDQFINCKIQSTCVVALYVKSSTKVTALNVTDSNVDHYHLSPIEEVVHNGEQMYQIDLSFKNSFYGRKSLCLMATDKNRESSDKVCIQLRIEPKDPCMSEPCQNSAECKKDTETDDFTCLCMPRYSGKTCSIWDNPCNPSPCYVNGSYGCRGFTEAHCYCKPGFIGRTCSESINDCHNDSCHGQGVCKDKVNGFDCECFDRYNGTRCETDRCPAQVNGATTCSQVHSSVNGSVTYLKVSAGSDFTLNCTLSILPPHTFSWSKINACGGNYETVKGSVFHEPHAAVVDSGQYACTTSDRTGKDTIHYFNVDVTSVNRQDTCTFDENSLCDWQQGRHDNFDWTIENGPTQSLGTGPPNDHTLGTSQGRYLYIETSSPRSVGEYASISSPLQPANRTKCFEFWYYMFGDGMGGLFVLLEDSCLKKETQIYKQTGDQGERWIKASVSIASTSVPHDYKIVIKADVGITYHGDIAIDDLTIHNGNCPGNTNAPIIG